MTASDKVFDLIERLRTEGKMFCVATILRTADSTSARPGAKAVVTTDGDLHGFVGGGCVTGAVRRGALACLESNEPQMIRIKPKDSVKSSADIDGVQLHEPSCPSEGTVEVFLEPMQSPRTLLICGASPISQAILPLAMFRRLTRVTAPGSPFKNRSTAVKTLIGWLQSCVAQEGDWMIVDLNPVLAPHEARRQMLFTGWSHIIACCI